MNYITLKKQLMQKFQEVNIDEMSDIDWIIVEITGKSRSMLPFIESFSDDEMKKIENAINQRLKHIPLGFIFGKSNFYGRDFFVTNDTLIPRIDTEILIEKTLFVIKNSFENFGKKAVVLDIGTGSGAIAITLKKEADVDVFAVDISENALEIASKNAQNLNADIKFLHSDLFDGVDNLKFDIIVSNPPYIKSDIVKTLEPEVRDNEPILALDGGVDGLDFYKKIVFQAKNFLNDDGYLIFEIGYDQGQEVKKLMEKDFENIEILKDYSYNDRVVCGKLRRMK